jgi:hypothetical protein
VTGETKMNDLILVYADDWEGLYINGEIKRENHTIRLHDILSFCPINSIIEKEVDWEWFDSNGGVFPESYAKIPEDAFLCR